MSTLTLALPSKGRLMEETLARFAAAGLSIVRDGTDRGYKGHVASLPEIAVAFLSASEIAAFLKSGRVHLGVTGEDLVAEAVGPGDPRIALVHRLGFGRADVVVAVPACWLDVDRMADVEQVAPAFRAVHGRHLLVATKYRSLTRRYFAERLVTSYRIVESLGATEGAPAAGHAEIIVDITSTGETLRANHLKILADGVILKSEAAVFASAAAAWSPEGSRLRVLVRDRLAKG
ncbi:MAG: ATP phosphoribosyltransferase [Hyphomicrobiaceae bacterium]